jgi:fructokinase
VIVVDANLRPAIVPDMAAYRRSVHAALQEAHLIKVSDDDLWTLGFDPATTDAITAARQLLMGTSAQALALTLGAKGAVLLQRHGQDWQAQEAHAVTVADTVGAGDCFLAGLIAAWLAQPDALHALNRGPLDLSHAQAHALLARAIASASLCVQQTGCVPPTDIEVLARIIATPIQFQAIAAL